LKLGNKNIGYNSCQFEAFGKVKKTTSPNQNEILYLQNAHLGVGRRGAEAFRAEPDGGRFFCGAVSPMAEASPGIGTARGGDRCPVAALRKN
jgi:hypothetical protein